MNQTTTLTLPDAGARETTRGTLRLLEVVAALAAPPAEAVGFVVATTCTRA